MRLIAMKHLGYARREARFLSLWEFDDQFRALLVMRGQQPAEQENLWNG